MTILIVEDNTHMRRMIKSLVAVLGEDVRECGDGSEALAAYEQCRPSWVLMDIRMNQVDGLTATRQIKAAHPEARVVIVTNYDDSDMREEARLAGACGYLLKENLLDVRRVLGDQSSRAPRT